MNIREIASLTQVSPSTVSKILNHKDDNISEETRRKVLEIVKKYQYVPHDNMVRTGLLGFASREPRDGYTAILAGVQDEAAQNGYSLLLSLDSGRECEKQLKIMQTKRVEGVVFLCDGAVDAFLDASDTRGCIPEVFIHEGEPQSDLLSVSCATEAAGYIATSHLLALGHRHIGLICRQSWRSEQLQKGYCRALFEAGLPYHSKDVFSSESAVDAGRIGTHGFLYEDVTAILCEDTSIASCAYRTLQSAGLRIPGDMSVVSASDAPEALLQLPTLSAVARPFEEMGRAAVRLLSEMLELKKPTLKPQLVYEPILHERGSVAAPSCKKLFAGGKLVVLGSMNMDINISVPHIPLDGETIISRLTALIPGGKGANQAVGAGRLGGRVYSIGRLGSDGDGRLVYNSLLANSVNTDGVVFDSDCSTGKAYISVAQTGESAIVVYPGANQRFDREQIKQFQHLLDGAAFCLISMEIPLPTVICALECCKKRSVQTIVKPAAVQSLAPELLCKIDYLIPNEKELLCLAEHGDTIEEKCAYFYENGVSNVIVTLGNKGCYVKNANYSLHFPAAGFEPLDTTGAADAFISALAVCLGEGGDILSAIRFATFAAGLSITRQGVQPAMPDRATMNIYQDEIAAFAPLEATYSTV